MHDETAVLLNCMSFKELHRPFVGKTMPRTESDRELSRKRIRRAKLAKIRFRYSTAKNESEKEALREKARKISPFVELG